MSELLEGPSATAGDEPVETLIIMGCMSINWEEPLNWLKTGLFFDYVEEKLNILMEFETSLQFL